MTILLTIFVVLNFLLLVVLFFTVLKKTDSKNIKDNSLETYKLFDELREKLISSVKEESKGQLNYLKDKLETLTSNLKKDNDGNFSRITEIQKNINEMNKSQNDVITKMGKSQNETINQMGKSQNEKMETFHRQTEMLRTNNEKKLTEIIKVIDEKLETIQKDNNKKLEDMRATVDEKLTKTLEGRLGQNFKMVSERLENVYKELGNIKSITSDVGDLKKVLTNVKTKGIVGEYQLENILEQILTSKQYEKEVITNPNTREKVEFAIKIPEKRGSEEKSIWIPIDSKFPLQSYQNLVDSYEVGDKEDIQSKQKLFYRDVEIRAKEIQKYICPPHTTPFAVMFLPIESIYAEVMRNNNLFEKLRNDYQVVVNGPSNFSAFLYSLNVGFKTITIEKKSNEVWQLLSGLKTEFSKFGGLIEKTRKKITEAGNHLDDVGVRSRAIERKFNKVEELEDPTEKTKLTDNSSQGELSF